MTHVELVERAVRWLWGTKRCNVVLSENASCSEVPDAIGWSTAGSWRGSIVVECKTSLSDFHADKKKYGEYHHPEHGYRYPAKRISAKEAAELNYVLNQTERMGRWRYYLTFPASGIGPDTVAEHQPDHGLLWARGSRITVVREALRRPDPDLESEVRLLQFAIVHIGSNLLARGCTVQMSELTKFNGQSGIILPGESEPTKLNAQMSLRVADPSGQQEDEP